MVTSTAVSTTNARLISIDLHLATTNLTGFSREDSGGQTLLRLEGAFDALSAPASRSALDTLVKERRSPVAIDMSAVRLIDSSGVGAIVSLYKRVVAQGGEVSVRGLNGQPLAIFRLLRLDRLMAAEHSAVA
jgi:anti-sigma B factor antagonist